MTPKPLHRSLTLWSGILLMGFICWAWRDSELFGIDVQHGYRKMSHGLSGVSFEHANYSETAFRRGRREPGGGAGIRFDPVPPPFYFRGSGKAGSFGPDNDAPENPTIKEHYRHAVARYFPSDCWILFIPHWLLLLTVALPWSGLLVWRAKRHHRARQSIRN